jgi:uncharacterized protein YqhQ
MPRRSRASARKRLGGQARADGLTLTDGERWGTALRLPDGVIVARAGEYPDTRGFLTTLLTQAEIGERAAAELRGVKRKPQDLDPLILRAVLAAIAVMLFTVPFGAALVAHAITGLPTAWVDLALRLALLGFVLRRAGALTTSLRHYHGAEHKTVACSESGLPLTAANVAAQSRVHPRCRTNLFVFILLFSSVSLFMLGDLNPWMHLLLQAPVGALSIMVGFTVVRLARYRFTRAIIWPGMLAQVATTAKPTAEHIEVALAAMAALVAPPPTPDTSRRVVGSCAACGSDLVRLAVEGDLASCSPECGAASIPEAMLDNARRMSPTREPNGARHR